MLKRKGSTLIISKSTVYVTCQLTFPSRELPICTNTLGSRRYGVFELITEEITVDETELLVGLFRNKQN